MHRAFCLLFILFGCQDPGTPLPQVFLEGEYSFDSGTGNYSDLSYFTLTRSANPETTWRYKLSFHFKGEGYWDTYFIDPVREYNLNEIDEIIVVYQSGSNQKCFEPIGCIDRFESIQLIRPPAPDKGIVTLCMACPNVDTRTGEVKLASFSEQFVGRYITNPNQKP